MRGKRKTRQKRVEPREEGMQDKDRSRCKCYQAMNINTEKLLSIIMGIDRERKCVKRINVRRKI